MTAVCSFIDSDVPMMIGDLAISELEREATNPAELPTRVKGAEPFQKGSGYLITNLRQKIVRLAPNYTMGWAGSLIHAKHFAREFQGFLKAKPRAPSEIENYLQTFDADVLRELQVLITYPNGQEVRLVGGGATEIYEIRNRHPVFFIGSGGEILFRDIEWIKRVGGPLREPEVNPVNNNFIRCAGLVGGLIRKEITESLGFHHYYGGGYELCGLKNGGIFEKLDGVTFTFWDLFAERFPGDRYEFSLKPIHVTRYIYTGDILTIKALHLGSMTNKTIEITSGKLFHIHPLLQEEFSELPEDFDLTSNVTCHYTSIFLNGAHVGALTENVFLNSDKADTRTWQIDANTIGYAINKDNLLDAATQFIRKMPAHLRS